MHKHTTFIVVDVETGGLDYEKNALTEIGALAINGFDFSQKENFCTLISPYYDKTLTYDDRALQVTGITIEKLQREGVDVRVAFNNFIDFVKKNTSFHDKKWKPILCGHNIGFDVGFIIKTANLCKVDLSLYFDGFLTPGKTFVPFTLDTQRLSYISHGNDENLKNNKLITLAEEFKVELNDAHRAMADVYATADVLINYFKRIRSNQSQSIEVKNQAKIRNNFPL